jgi:MFS family permease
MLLLCAALCFADSLVSRFSLVCGEAWKVQLTNSLFFVGAFAGSGLFGLLCDRWGRKVPLFLATGFVAASMFGLLDATSYWAVAGLRVLGGAGAAGQSHCCFLLATECVGPDARCVWHCARAVLQSNGLKCMLLSLMPCRYLERAGNEQDCPNDGVPCAGCMCDQQLKFTLTCACCCC